MEFEQSFQRTDTMTINTVYSVRLRWRKQINKDNGQIISFNCDLKHPDFCPVRAAFRIYLRAGRLQANADEPIAVCRNKANAKTIFIADSLTTKFLRKAAMGAHNISSASPDLNRWSTHSIRVTAANLLHRAKFSDSFIQTRLRWKSTAFLQYLRNTFYSAEAHSKAIGISENNFPPVQDRSYRALDPHEAFTLTSAAPAA